MKEKLVWKDSYWFIIVGFLFFIILCAVFYLGILVGEASIDLNSVCQTKFKINPLG